MDIHASFVQVQFRKRKEEEKALVKGKAANRNSASRSAEKSLGTT